MQICKSEYERRIDAVQRLLSERKLDAALIYYDELNIADGWYLSGWCPQFESGMILVPKEGEPWILGAPESEPFAKLDSTIKRTRNITVFMVPEEEYPQATVSSFDEIFKEIFRGEKVKKIGIVGLNKMPYGVYQQLRDELKEIEFIDITKEFEELRIIKSSWEIEMMKCSFQIADEAFKALKDNVQPGVPEYVVAAAAEAKARSLGANGFGFKTIVASGERSNGVVPTASNKKLQEGEIVLAGIGVRYQGYNSAAGCSLVVGENPSPEQKKYLHDVAEAFGLAREQLVPGSVGKNIDSVPRKYLGEKGYGPYQLIPYAHTIGLLEAEAPFFGPGSENALQPNMTVCIDVSLFGHPTLYGMRMETGYLITEEGTKPLSEYMESLILQHI